MRTRSLCLSLVILLAAACAPLAEPLPAAAPTATPPAPEQPAAATPGAGAPATPAGQPYDPQPGDAAWTRGEVFLDSAEIVVRESYPPQVSLMLVGTLPTPCHQLRVAVAAPDAQRRILVEAYSVADPAMACIQVLADFQQAVALANPPAGTYTVWVNGQKAGEFTE